MSKVSNNNTKSEILAAYEELLEQIKNERKDSTALRQELEKKQQLLEKANNVAKGEATLSLQQIRKSLNEQLDQLEQRFVTEQQNYETLTQGVAALKQELNHLHQIKAEAESLEALIISNRQAKEKLEKDMEERRFALEAVIEHTQTKWAREQEAYDYDLKLKRRNEQDAYQEKKAKMEKELSEKKIEFDRTMSEREQAIVAQEEEIKRLRKESESFDTRLNAAVQQAEKAVIERLTREFDYQQKIQIKDLEAELRLREQMIQSLENKVKEQQSTMSAMSERTDLAGQQVKDIALKAIEKSGLIGVPVDHRSREKEG
ncbi:MAG TPA: hypothetical protein PKA00_05545 [Saprospiraceae bacterium]|nr:hypothetical protein [Saprospiraceae bacterium]HMQ82345.1 hypothetical protein [Saprospiraceae bacterium]